MSTSSITSTDDESNQSIPSLTTSSSSSSVSRTTRSKLYSTNEKCVFGYLRNNNDEMHIPVDIMRMCLLFFHEILPRFEWNTRINSSQNKNSQKIIDIRLNRMDELHLI